MLSSFQKSWGHSQLSICFILGKNNDRWACTQCLYSYSELYCDV